MVPVSETTPAAERLLNLVIALVNAGRRMTREQIRASVVGYAGTSDAAFERTFERDKDLLRELGVPIVTVEGAHATETGYRIDMDAYALEPLELSPAQLAVLGVAAELWQDRMLRDDTARALTKLRAAGGPAPDTEGAAVAALAPRVREAGDAYGPLLDATTSRRAVTFDYRAASTGELTRRTVEPWRVVARGGGWYVIGRDRSRDAARAFRLSRIAGRVRAVGPENAFPVPADLDVDDLLGTSRVAVPAVVAVVPERAAALRAHGRVVTPAEAVELGAPARLPERLVGREILAVDADDPDALAGEIVGYGDAVVVLAPPQVRAAVVAMLDAAADLPDKAQHATEDHHG